MSKIRNRNQRFMSEVAAYPKTMPPFDVVKTEVLRAGLTEEDARYLYDHWLANGFRVGRNKVVKWTAVISKWKVDKCFPSQKHAARMKPRDFNKEREQAFLDRLNRTDQ